MNGLESEYGVQIDFVRLNAAEPGNEAIQRGYGLRGHPTVALVDVNGTAQATFIGEQSAETLRVALNALLNNE